MQPAKRSIFRCFAVLFAACCLGRAGLANATDPTPPGCDQAGQAAEHRFGLPPGLLLAVGRIESGRRIVPGGRTVPWPWAVDVNGQGQLFDTRAQALRAASDALAIGQRNVDIGCFQINLQHHPFAFADLVQAFDPVANANYAAQFLAELHTRLGNWQAAVAAYHSADPQHGEPYRRRVFAAWSGGEPAAGSNPAGFTLISGVRVWTPVPPGMAPQSIVLGPVAQHLPHVITPNG